MPWGDITVKSHRLFLSVFEWPASGKLYLPGLKTRIKSARLLTGEGLRCADVNGDGLEDGRDVAAFVDHLLQGDCAE